MDTEHTLREILRRIDRRSYKAYSELRGRGFDLRDLELYVDRVQGDPFAAPSLLRVRHPYAAAGLPTGLRATAVAELAFRDWIARRVQRGLARADAPTQGRRGSGGSGRVSIDAGGQTILDRSAVHLDGDAVELRLEAGLPAAGRRILGDAAASLLLEGIPKVANRALDLDEGACAEALAFCECAENQEFIRGELEGRGLVAFVADDSLLPRASGVDDAPLPRARPFRSPDALRVVFELPRRPHRIAGLGIPRGVTLIVGGGYHGKSTLLQALERAVYPHIPDDGREGVVCDATAVKIRAEDGRRVAGVDIEPFVRDLPFGADTRRFDSDDASGSTSQAANAMEAFEVGARVLLMDEDTCAANFMTRDARMQALVAPTREPITPLVDRVRELYEQHAVSTILVAGSSGDFFSTADTVIEMASFAPVERSAEARALGAHRAGRRRREAEAPFRSPAPRVPELHSLAPEGTRARPGKIAVRERDRIRWGRTDIDLRGCDQIVDASQTRAIGRCLLWIAERGRPDACLATLLDALDEALERQGLEALNRAKSGQHPGNLARPRRFEVAAALNRLRTLRIRSPAPGA